MLIGQDQNTCEESVREVDEIRRVKADQEAVNTCGVEKLRKEYGRLARVSDTTRLQQHDEFLQSLRVVGAIGAYVICLISILIYPSLIDMFHLLNPILCIY